jgi:hypothetical protein
MRTDFFLFKDEMGEMMISLSEEFRETHTWDYLLMVDPMVQVEYEEYDNWTAELLKKGFGWHRNRCMLDVTFIEPEERRQLQAFLDQHGLWYRIEPTLRP